MLIPLKFPFVFSDHIKKIPHHAGYSPVCIIRKTWTSPCNYITRILIFELPCQTWECSVLSVYTRLWHPYPKYFSFTPSCFIKQALLEFLLPMFHRVQFGTCYLSSQTSGHLRLRGAPWKYKYCIYKYYISSFTHSHSSWCTWSGTSPWPGRLVSPLGPRWLLFLCCKEGELQR